MSKSVKSSKKVVKKTTTKAKAPTKSQKQNIFKITQDKVKSFFKKFDLKGRFNKIRTLKFWSTKLARGLGITLLLIASFIIIDFVVQYINNDYSIAVVDNVRVSRREYINELEKKYGSTVASELIDKQILENGIKSKSIVVTQEEINTSAQGYYDQFGGKETLLNYYSLTEKEFLDAVKQSLEIEKIFDRDSITYTEADLKTFFDDMKEQGYFAATDKYDTYKDQIGDYYVNYKIQELSSNWQEELKNKAIIQNNSTSKPAYGFLKTTINIVKGLYGTISDLLKK